MPGCKHPTLRKENKYCARAGRHSAMVRIDVSLQHDWWWNARCDRCPDFSASSLVKDEAIEDAYIHQQIDHPRDLVAYSIQ